MAPTTASAFERDITDPTPDVRLEAYDEIDEMDSLDQRIVALAELVDAVQERDGAGIDQSIQNTIIHGYVGTDVPRFSLAQAHRHLADFADNYEGYTVGAGQDGDLIREISLDGSLQNVTHHTFYAVQQLYARAVRELLEERTTRETVYRAAYERMWELCKDTRAIEYQMHMRDEYGCRSAHELAAGEWDLAWDDDTVDRIAFRMLQASLGAFDNIPVREVDEHYTYGSPRPSYAGELHAIISAVDGETMANIVLGGEVAD